MVSKETNPLEEIEALIKEELTTTIISVFNDLFATIPKDQVVYFNQHNISVLKSLVYWTLNVNTIQINHGDITTNSIIKFFQLIFTDNKSITQDNKAFQQYKIDFIAKFETIYLTKLNEQHNQERIVLYEIRNGYINVYLTPKEKEAISNVIEERKQSYANKYTFESIGVLESCFPEKFSVPRQGNLLELTRGRIVVNKLINMEAFEGLEQFDYIWVVYVFHLHQGFQKTKISPPKYSQGKLGIFATRTPHRINPIGLTLCKLEKIEKHYIYISSVDMVTDTPILDIKPYHHLEAIDLSHSKYPDWIRNSALSEKKATVTISNEAMKNLEDILLAKKLMFYDKKEEIIELIKGILEIDPHSKFTQKKTDTLLYAFHLDKLNVVYDYNSQKQEITVFEIQYSEVYQKLRNKEWTESYKIKSD